MAEFISFVLNLVSVTINWSQFIVFVLPIHDYWILGRQTCYELQKSIWMSLILSGITFRKKIEANQFQQKILILFATVKFHMNYKSRLKLGEQRQILGVNITNAFFFFFFFFFFGEFIWSSKIIISPRKKKSLFCYTFECGNYLCEGQTKNPSIK